MNGINDVRMWAKKRLSEHRERLEGLTTTDLQTTILRARIAELKELLDALRNETPPVWITPAE